MNRRHHFCPHITVLAALLFTSLGAVADDDDALSLQSDAPIAPTSADRPWRLYAEGALGRQQNRYTQDQATTSRVSIDYSISAPLAGNWRGTFSDRLDALRPVESGQDRIVNSLREAYVSWQDAEKTLSVDIGRVNLRNGPSYGFNPTDYFRSGALRAITTADPLALRENRLGTVMIRGQRLWEGGAFSLAIAPKLTERPSDAGWNVDLGATNARNRALASFSLQLVRGVSSQALWYVEQGSSPQFGLNLTGLLSDSLVTQVEWSHGRSPDTLAGATGVNSGGQGSDKWSAGLTYTTASKLALTAEYQFNGSAATASGWRTAVTEAPDRLEAYYRRAGSNQDTASRGAFLLYALQKDFASIKGMDVTGLWRRNASDGSTFTWLEARQHWTSFDVAAQWQLARGQPGSEYGILPQRQWFQVIGAWYF